MTYRVVAYRTHAEHSAQGRKTFGRITADLKTKGLVLQLAIVALHDFMKFRGPQALNDTNVYRAHGHHNYGTLIAESLDMDPLQEVRASRLKQRAEGVSVKLPGGQTVESLEIGENEISQERVREILKAIKASEQTGSGVLSVSREMVRAGDESTFKESPQQRELGAIALAISPQAVFSDARRRMSVVFKVNLAVAIVLAIILLSGLAGAVFSALFLRNNIWASVFGGISAADVIALMVFKPLTAINSALIGAQRLEMIQLRLSQQLQACTEHEKLQQRIKCQTIVWDTIQKELALLGATPAPQSKSN